MDKVVQNFFVARAGLGQASQCGLVAPEASSLFAHQLVLTLLGFGKLRGDDHQAQIDHEEGAHLKQSKQNKVKQGRHVK